MASNIKLFLMLLNNIIGSESFQGMFGCEGVSWLRQLEHIAKTSLENEGIFNPSPSRRFYQFDPREMSNILGVPSRASHLPEAEPIQPGHTLLRPALGMLKSALKFPHKELEDGAGVYGNIDNLGLKYDSRNERLMYSGFRRSPADYIMVIPSSSPDKYEIPRFKLESAVLNLDRQAKAKNEILKILKKLNRPALKGVEVYMATENGNNFENVGISSGKESSYYLNEDTPKHVSESESKEILRKDHDAHEKNIVSVISSELEITPTNSNSADKKRKISEDLAKEKSKKKLMWPHSMGAYDHINLIQEAPEIDDFVPTIDETIDETNSDLRKWWFYNADDYQPFSRERHR